MQWTRQYHDQNSKTPAHVTYTFKIGVEEMNERPLVGAVGDQVPENLADQQNVQMMGEEAKLAEAGQEED